MNYSFPAIPQIFYGFSPTEERLRSMVEKLSSAITEEARVVVTPGDAWAAFPTKNPKQIVYKLADVGVMPPDETLGVVAHEIAHLLYTDKQPEWPFDISKRPRAAHLLWNSVEDSRIERIMADHLPGAQSLFDLLRSDTYDLKVQRGFNELPIKWRFILNIDRVLHGLEPWGEQIDVDAVELVLDDVIECMLADTVDECVSHLERPYNVMLDLMRKEAMDADPNLQKNFGDVPLSVPPEWLGLPPDYTSVMQQFEDVQMRSGEATDHGFDQGADQDDHQIGGMDGTAGKREQADGSGAQGEGNSGEGSGESGDGVEEGEGEGSGGSGTGGEAGQSSGSHDSGAATGAGSGVGDPLDSTNETNNPDPAGFKPTNIIDEMVKEEAGSGNKTIDILAYRQRQREKQSKAVAQKIASEEENFMREMETVFNRQRNSPEFRDRMRRNSQKYEQDKALFRTQIKVLRGYAENVLRDNALERFGGNFTSGRRVKTSRLYRLQTDDPRLFVKRQFVGGKSYDIALTVDQSTSMRSAQKQELAYQAALIFIEAFDGLTGTVLCGFTDFGTPGHGYMQGLAHRYHYGDAIQSRTYKSLKSHLGRRKAAIPELIYSYGGTPMEAGIKAATDQLRQSSAEVQAMVVLSDGQPNFEHNARAELMIARRLGIKTYGLHIAGRDLYEGDAGFRFMADACDRAVQVHGATDVPNAVNRLLRGIIRTKVVA